MVPAISMLQEDEGSPAWPLTVMVDTVVMVRVVVPLMVMLLMNWVGQSAGGTAGVVGEKVSKVTGSSPETVTVMAVKEGIMSAMTPSSDRKGIRRTNLEHVILI